MSRRFESLRRVQTHSTVVEQEPVLACPRSNVIEVCDDFVPATGADEPIGACREGPLSCGTLPRTAIRRANAAIQYRGIVILYVASINKLVSIQLFDY